ncbi:MAG: PQQ-dependent catabolism-associated CXXCW motif protein [Geminicoccaceae bacterium]
MPALACDVETPDGYRQGHYRAPTPCDLAGARVVTTEQMRSLVEDQDPVLIDAMPLVRTSETDFTGRWTMPEPRENIPGSVWLPNIGHGSLDDEMTAYFRDNLRQVTAGDRHRPLVFYCFVDCWMSWNAAKRALDFGYRNVIWYPEGTDGWKEAGFTLAPSTPAPLFEE